MSYIVIDLYAWRDREQSNVGELNHARNVQAGDTVYKEPHGFEYPVRIVTGKAIAALYNG